MSKSFLSPGVYLSEVDYSSYVSDSSSCVVGMVGGARRGPIGVPTLVTTQAQMVEIFGEPVEGEYGVYSALQCLTRCNQLYYTRVIRSGLRATAGILGTDKILFQGKEKGTAFNGIQIIVAASTVNEHVVVGITVKDAEDNVLEEYSDMSIDREDINFVETVVNKQSDYIIADVQYSGTLQSKVFVLGATDDTKGEGTGAYSRAGDEQTDKVMFRSKNFDSSLNGCSVIISEPDYYGYFNVSIVNRDSTVVERWNALQIDSDTDRYIENIINKDSNRVVCTVNPDSNIELEAKTMVFSGGDDAIDGISSTDIIGETTGTGLYSFSNPETVSIDVLTVPGWTSTDVVTASISIAENRADCIYVMDSPFGMSAQEVLNWSNGAESYANHNGWDSSYAALYWPWIKISDVYTKKDIWLPPSGFVAGQYAYNDKIGYPWNAPAGLSRGRIPQAVGTELSPTQGERDAIYGNRNIINPIVNFISNGVIIWGQKTCLRSPSSLDRVNVRRLLNYLKTNIGYVTKNFVFEQNIESTWERWRTAVEPILKNCKASSGLYEYKIVINPEDIDVENNRMPIQIYVKPTRTAEFISLTFNIMQYSASFDEL